MNIFGYGAFSCPLVLLLLCNIAKTEEPGKLKILNHKGDINLAAIFNVHFWNEDEKNKCGDIDPQMGVMYVEALFFALDKINADPTLLPGLKMGAVVYDTCGHTRNLRDILVYAARQGVNGIVGPQYSDDAMMTSIVMDIFGKPVISYSATSVALHDRSKYGNFYRTVPSDNNQVQVMIDLARTFKWTYVAILNSEGSYGEKMASEFKKRATKLRICYPTSYTVPKRSTLNIYLRYLGSIFSESKIKVLYLFLTDIEVRNFLLITKEYFSKEAARVTFVTGDSWGNSVSIIRGVEDIALGSITVQQSTMNIEEFHDYYLALNVVNNTRNIWFQEFWEATFNCTLNASDGTGPFCTGREKLRPGKGYYDATNVKAVINAVYAFANGFTQMIDENCKPRNYTVKKCISKGLFSRYSIMYRKFQTLRFLEPFGNETINFEHFDSLHDGYDILNIQKSAHRDFGYVKVGQWRRQNASYVMPYERKSYLEDQTFELTENRLKVNNNHIIWKSKNSTMPVSICSVPCNYNQIFVFKDFQQCCWTCKACHSNDRIENNTCARCPLDHIPDSALTRCLPLPIHHVSLTSPESILILSFSAIGLLFTLFVSAVFLKNFNMRAVRASGRELCLNILLGIAIVYLSPALFLMKPTSIVCGAQRFVIGLGFSLCYASLFLKTNRIYRIFKSAQTSVLRPSMVSPQSQVFMAIALSAVQLLLGIVWVQGEPPLIVTSYPQHRHYVIQYCEMKTYTLALNLSYSSILMLISTWFAFKTRNFPKNYNEAKHIGFTMYSSCFALGVFMPIFFFIENDERTAKIYLTCAVCEVIATINVIGLFGPKVKLILLPAKAPGIDPNVQTTDFDSVKAGLKFVTLPKMKP